MPGHIAQSLDGSGNRTLICHDYLAQRSIVIYIVGHHLQDAGKVNQGYECRIESLLLCGIHQLLVSRKGVAREPIGHVQDLLGIRGCRRNLREEIVRIQRNRRK